MNIDFEVSRTYPIKSIEQIRRDFFKYHTYREGDQTFSVRPNTVLLNPDALVRTDDPFSQELWLVLYCRGFYVIVSQNIHHVEGPHAAKLYLQVYPGKPGSWVGKFVHLGTTQFLYNFYSKKHLLARLRKAARLRQYFASEEMQAELVEFDEPHPEIVKVS